MLDDDFLEFPLVLGAADALHDFVYDDVVELDVVLFLSDADLDVCNVDLVLPILDVYDVLDGDHLVDVSLGDLDVDDLVYLLVDVLVDVLGLHSHCRFTKWFSCYRPPSEKLFVAILAAKKGPKIKPHLLLRKLERMSLYV